MEALSNIVLSLEAAISTILVMGVGWVMQYRKTKNEINKAKEEITTLSNQNANLKAQTDNEIIKGWKLQMEHNNETLNRLLTVNKEKEKVIDDLKEQLTLAKDALIEANSELKRARVSIANLKRYIATKLEVDIQDLDRDLLGVITTKSKT